MPDHAGGKEAVEGDASHVMKEAYHSSSRQRRSHSRLFHRSARCSVRTGSGDPRS